MKTKNKSLLKSFEHAFNGLYHFFKHEHNGRLEIGIAVVSIAFAFWMGISIIEWIAIIFCIALVGDSGDKDHLIPEQIDQVIVWRKTEQISWRSF